MVESVWCRQGSSDRQKKLHVPWQTTGLQPIVQSTPLSQVEHVGYSHKGSAGLDGLEEPVCPLPCPIVCAKVLPSGAASLAVRTSPFRSPCRTV